MTDDQPDELDEAAEVIGLHDHPAEHAESDSIAELLRLAENRLAVGRHARRHGDSDEALADLVEANAAASLAAAYAATALRDLLAPLVEQYLAGGVHLDVGGRATPAAATSAIEAALRHRAARQ